MPEVGRLFDLAAARAARDDAIEHADDHADPEWKAAAFDVVCQLASITTEFTTDRVWFELEALGIEGPREPRALGPVMQRAMRMHLIENTHRMHESRSKVNHGRLITIWKSLVFSENT